MTNDLATNKPSDMSPAQREALLNDLDEYADEIGGSHYPFLKHKQGHWLAGQEDKAVMQGAVVCMDLWNLVEGWQKWRNNTLQDSQMGCRTKGFHVAQRGSLDDNDEAHWEVGEDGNAMDPWTRTMNVLFMFADGHSPLDTNAVVFGTSSAGGRGAIGEIYRTYVQHIRQYPDDMPVVKMGVTTFKWTNKAGREMDIWKPTFELMGWATAEGWESGNQYNKKDFARAPVNTEAARSSTASQAKQANTKAKAQQKAVDEWQAPINDDPLNYEGPIDDVLNKPREF